MYNILSTDERWINLRIKILIKYLIYVHTTLKRRLALIIHCILPPQNITKNTHKNELELHRIKMKNIKTIQLTQYHQTSSSNWPAQGRIHLYFKVLKLIQL